MDPRNDVRQRLRASGCLAELRRGARVGITAGSRGIGGFVELLAGTADAVREAGGEPFLVPAMGSHGGAVASGQAEILRRLGVSERDVGAQIRAGMETVPLGRCATGAVAHVDRIAHDADGIIVLGRVKTHPEWKSGLSSGLLKMLAVGLGKQRGAQEVHSHGLWESVREAPRITLAKTRVLCGVAVVESARRWPVRVEVVPPRYDAFLDADLRLLEVARRHAARLPFAALDLLIVDELGKDVSGTGMDLNVIGSWRLDGGRREPDIRRIAVLSLTRASLGNGLGIGCADVTTQRFAREFDPHVTWVNLMTASEPGSMNTREGALPLALASDREAVEVALASALPGPRPRVCRIRNTAELEHLWCSPALLDEIAGDSVTVEEPPARVAYDSAGALDPPGLRSESPSSRPG